MNQTIKNLVSEKIINFITVKCGDKIVVESERVDVKKGRIRLWDTPESVHTALSLADLDMTEDEAEQLVKHCITEALFANSDKPVTTDFKIR